MQSEANWSSADAGLISCLPKLLARSSSKSDYLSGVAELIRDWSGCRCVGIRVLDRDGNVPYEAHVGFSEEFWESENWVSLEGFTTGLTEEEQRRFHGVCVSWGFASVSVVPFRWEDGILGGIHLADERDGMVPSDRVELLELVAPFIGEAIHRFGIEEKLRQSRDTEQRYRQIVETASEGIWIIDEQSRTTFVNNQLAEMLGYSADEMLGRPLLDFVGERQDIVAGKLEERRRGSAERYEIRLRREDGSHLWTILSTRPLFDSEGRYTGAVAMLTDITEQKRLEERLIRAQRLEAAGLVAGGIAHDFGNLLGPLATYAELIRMRLPHDRVIAKYCVDMQEIVQQMADINQDLMALGRRGNLALQAISLNSLVEQVLAQMPEQPEGLLVRLDLASDLSPVNGSPVQIQRVISNLITNAREAMGDNGLLWIKTENARIEGSDGNAAEPRVGEHVKLTIGDTGCGIPPEIKDRIFDAFFTTKISDERRGSGLGLSIVRAILEDHGGRVEVESEVGRGTVFNVYVPALQVAVADQSWSV